MRPYWLWAFSCFSFFKHKHKVADQTISRVSPYLNQIRAINDQYEFKQIKVTREQYAEHLRSKKQFDHFDDKKQSYAYILSKSAHFQRIVDDIEYNIALLSQYQKALDEVKPLDDASLAKQYKISLKYFNNKEMKLVRSIIKHPTTRYTFTYEWSYVSPAGRNSYLNRRSFSVEEIKAVLQHKKKTAEVINHQDEVTLDDIPDAE